jgi:hypothetical protein
LALASPTTTNSCSIAIVATVTTIKIPVLMVDDVELPQMSHLSKDIFLIG